MQAAERAASADLADAELDTNRAAETVIERVYWDEPTQSVQVLDTRTPTSAPSPPWAPAAARETQTEPTPSPPVAPLPMHPAATTRRILVPLGGAAAVTIALLVWAMRPATTPTPTTDASAVSTPSDAGEIAAEPLLTATPRGDAGALAEFQSPLPNRPAGTAPAPAVVPGTGGTTRPVPGPAPVTAVVTPVGSANTGPRPNVPPTAPPLVPPSKTPPLTPSVTPPNPGGSATPSGTGGPGATGAATPAVIPPPPPPTPVSPASGTTTNPGAVVPVGGIIAAPAGGASASRQLDETTIQRLVSAFGQAYQSKDLQALKAVWPEMRGGDENSYRNVFNSYRTINWVTGDTNIRFDGERADARAAVQVTQRALRPDTTTTQSRTYRFQFERRAKGWVLTGVENLGAAR